MTGRLVRRTVLTLAGLLCLSQGVAGATDSPAPEAPVVEGGRTLIGSYLAGRFARAQHDTAAAAEYYRTALALDPANDLLLEQAFLMEASDGNWPRAMRLAEEIVALQPTHRLAHLFLGLSAFKAGNLDNADEHFKTASSGPVGELTGALARSWVKLGQGKADEALQMLDLPKQAEWAQFYLNYHRALIADIDGRTMEARAAFERVYKQDNRTLRIVLAYAQHANAFGDTKLARQILKEQLDRTQGDGHPLARDLDTRIEAGERMGLLVPNANEGLAEVFYGLGEALTGEGSVSPGVVYLQMALYLSPRHPFALAALASGYETAKKYAEALAIYDRIPKGSALQSSIDIRRAFDLNSLEEPDKAKALLDEVIMREPNDLKPLDAMGNIMRARKRYAEAADYYTRAIALISKPEKRHWTYYYARGTCYERLKNWSKAEADLQKAMQLYPDQPLVLNYLGYSWVDQGHNLKQGMALIEKAVQLKPDDGYIVDSLGWAHYKQGNYRDAARYLEKAVELRPEDPVLNDHLGDALWRVGREREARFQWDQALTLNPEPEDAEKLRAKLEKGLPAQAAAAKKAKEVKTDAPAKKRTATKAVPRLQ